MAKYIFRVDYTDDYHHRVPIYGGMDSEYSHTTREPGHDFILSNENDVGLVETIWRYRNRYRMDRLGDVKFSAVGYSNMSI